jgi:hypothetical protein
MPTTGESLTRAQLAENIRAYAIRLHHFDTRGDADKKALNEASKLLIAATMYEQLMVQQVGFLPCLGEN